MSSMVNTAVTAIVLALQTPAPVGAAIYRVRLRPIAQQSDQAVVVRAEQCDVTQVAMLSGSPVTWDSLVSVECYQRATSSTSADVAIDALVEAVYARLMTDQTLGGAVLAMVPKGISFEYDADGDQTACATLVFILRHRTSGASLS